MILRVRLDGFPLDVAAAFARSARPFALLRSLGYVPASPESRINASGGAS